MYFHLSVSFQETGNETLGSEKEYKRAPWRVGIGGKTKLFAQDCIYTHNMIV